jgi:hypothetical protein
VTVLCTFTTSTQRKCRVKYKLSTRGLHYMQRRLDTVPCLLHWHIGTAAQCMYPYYHYFLCILYVVQRRFQYTLPALTVFCSAENVLLAAQNWGAQKRPFYIIFLVCSLYTHSERTTRWWCQQCQSP